MVVDLMDKKMASMIDEGVVMEFQVFMSLYK